MEYTAPETKMPINFREKETTAALSVINKVHNFAFLNYIHYNMGTTRLIRYISINPTVKRKIDVVCIDCEWLYISGKLADTLERELEKYSSPVCFTIMNILPERREDLLKTIIAFRNTHKGAVCFLTDIILNPAEKENDLGNYFDALFGGNYMHVAPLEQQDLKWVIKDMFKETGVTPTKYDIETVIKNVPSKDLVKIKKYITGKKVPENSKNIVFTQNGVLKIGNKALSEIAENYFTKAESMVLKKLIENQSLLTEKDVLAVALQPQTLGQNVSDEVIHQLISRLRKKLSTLAVDNTIETIRQRGYIFR